jgi:HEAT repeats
MSVYILIGFPSYPVVLLPHKDLRIEYSGLKTVRVRSRMGTLVFNTEMEEIMSKSPIHKKSQEIGNIPALVAALAHDDPVERNHVREALVAIGKPAVKYLIKLLSDPRPHVRWEVAKALGPIGDPAAAAALVNALEDEDTDVRWLAAAGLITLGCSGLEPLLAALIKRPDSIWLRDGAHHIFHDLVGKLPFHLAGRMLAILDQPDSELAIPEAAYEALNDLKTLFGDS